LHPATLALLALWVANDHVLKAAFGNWLTGKLSDVASLAVGPLLVLAAAELSGLCVRPATRRLVLALAIAGFGFAMIAIKLHAPSAELYRIGLGALQWPLRASGALVRMQGLPALVPVRLAMDPSDLWTLPSLWIAWRVGRGSIERAPSAAAVAAARAS
jgi:hypothetical protein